MTKSERLAIEASARAAIGALLGGIKAERAVLNIGNAGAKHEFDIYFAGKVIGGVSTSPLKNFPKVGQKATPNTSGQDRACSELLWLSLWPGQERRVHVLTDRPLADWLLQKYRGIPFPNEISIYHFNPTSSLLTDLGVVGR